MPKMPKSKVLYNQKTHRRRRNPARQARNSPPHVSVAFARLNREAVDAVLTETPTLDDRIHRSRQQGTMSKPNPAQKALPTQKERSRGKPKDDRDNIPVNRPKKASPAQRSDEADDDDVTELEDFGLTQGESGTDGHFFDLDPPEDDEEEEYEAEDGRAPISPTESAEELQNNRSNRDAKALRRMEDCGRRSTSPPLTSRQKGHAAALLAKEREKSREKDDLILQMQEEKRANEEQIATLTAQQNLAKAAIMRFAPNRSRKTTSGLNSGAHGQKRPANDDEEFVPSDGEAVSDVDGTDDSGSDSGEHLPVKSKSMMNLGKVAVKSVFRQVKFIAFNEQEKVFCDMVMDNLGIAKLVEPTPEQKQTMDPKVVAGIMRLRKKYKKHYGKFWVHYLNEFRSYTQVSDQMF